MSLSTRTRSGAVVLAVLASGACAPNHGEEGSPMAADTARGIVEIVGAEPITSVRIATADGRLTLTGPDADGLRLAAGTEVWVAGTREAGDGFRIEAFAVRAIDGMAAVDGILELDGDAAVLVTRTGDRVRFAPAPAGLRPLEGRRVWIAGPAGGEPQAWGSLDRTHNHE
jgi:hypothetical protein